MALEKYRAKRHFRVTPEPRGRAARERGNRYVIQKHDATRLHYDLRLELDGVLKSWAVPKGPSLDPREKRLAVEVEDHPLEYGGFEGRIPRGEYGAGQVIVWDRGTWEPLEDPRAGLGRGRLKFELHGEKLRGAWMLVRMGGRAAEERRPNWLLIKERDAFARRAGERDILTERPESVASGTTLDRDAADRGRHARGARRAPASRSREIAAAKVEGARPGRLPAKVSPQLATLVKTPVTGDGWLHEIKFDGYRMLARIEDGRVRMLSRTGQDWTGRFEPVTRALAKVPHRALLLDGEIVVLEADGTTRFQALQNALGRGGGAGLVYFVFDVLHADGIDLTGAPLEARKRVLEQLLGGLPERSPIRYSAHVEGNGEAFHGEACRRGLEGVVSKRRDAPYRQARTRDWLKVKCSRRQEFVIGGYTDPAGARKGVGALLVGVYDEQDRLRYAGRVGTGFDDATLQDLARRLKALARTDAPFADAPRGRTTHWVTPRLVAEVAFTEWTADGRLRHPSFQGLREDKPAKQVRRESASAPSAGRAAPRSARRGTTRAPQPAARGPGHGATAVAGVTLTHPDRVLFPDSGLTKADVARYYEAVAPPMLREIANRPLMLKRCPSGQGGPCFFQKHPGATLPVPPLAPVEIRESAGTDTYVTVHDVSGLVTLVQFGVLELHVWGSRAARLEQPDRMVFDLDPGPAVEWKRVVALARGLHERLTAIGLESFVKTTGGKGLHVVVPLTPDAGWDDVLEFSQAVARGLVNEDPQHLTMRMAKAGREGKILIDTMRNGRGATWVAAWSTRARPGAPVSTPIDWEELTPSLRSDRFTVADVPRRLARGRDPWSRLERGRRKLTRAMRRAVGRAGADD